MLPPPSLLVLAILQGPPAAQPPTADCQDVRRVELSRVRGTSQEICVSPGLLTGVVFDTPVVLDLEDELRFAAVTHGRTNISIMPPGDGVAGERFRLTARFADGASVTFVLVLHSGQATRQVEVYRDKRMSESFQHELAQERAKNRQLQRELERLQHQLEQLRVEAADPGDLRRLIASDEIDETGIRALGIKRVSHGNSKEHLSFIRGTVYRSKKRLTLEVWLDNLGEEPWSVIVATLVDAQGQEMPGTRFWQEGGPLRPAQAGMVVVQIDMEPGGPHREVTLTLREEGPRAIRIPQVAIPYR